MLAFKNENVISKYDVVVQDSSTAKTVIQEILSQEKHEKTSAPAMIWTNHGNFDESVIKLCEYGFIWEVQSPEFLCSDYSPGSIYKDRYTYPAPYTLALAAQSFEFRKDFDYSKLLKQYDKAESLIDVLHGTALDDVSLLLSCFNNNLEALDTYLRNYHPDLLYLRKYLECIYLSKTDEYPLEAIHREEDVKIPAMNSEVVRKLSLPIEFRN